MLIWVKKYIINNNIEIDENLITGIITPDRDIVENSNNSISLIYNTDLGKKAKIKKIKFIGDKK